MHSRRNKAKRSATRAAGRGNRAVSAGPSRRRPAPAPAHTRADLRRARRVLDLEAAALRALRRRLDSSFEEAVALLLSCHGKVVVTGLGKSGQIARKIASTLSSTGTPAFFLHTAEGLHGDSGMIMKGDVVVALSNSGETEVVHLLPVIKRLGLPLIAITGNCSSTLAQAADVVLDASVAEEACPMNLAPTASTTAALALGDALAVTVLQRKNFRSEDFALLHPGGRLGQRFLRVDELVHRGEHLPLVAEDASLRATLLEMTRKRLGTTGVVDAGGSLVGVITDGDLRRALERHGDLRRLAARDMMTTRPKSIAAGALAEQAVATMERYSITSLFVLENGTGIPVGIVHLHDLLKAGVV